MSDRPRYVEPEPDDGRASRIAASLVLLAVGAGIAALVLGGWL